MNHVIAGTIAAVLALGSTAALSQETKRTLPVTADVASKKDRKSKAKFSTKSKYAIIEQRDLSPRQQAWFERTRVPSLNR